ncbi:MAG: hypothetical protein Phog2KO_40190 [Phototrophicaceae bacterium]
MTVKPNIRKQVRQRANGYCEYCQQIEYATGFSYHVDHIIAKKHLGTNDLDNLAWSCFDCNVFKGTDIASYDLDTGELIALYNPRIQLWEDHFAKNDLIIIGKTPIGRVTARILKFNHEDRLDNRHYLQLLGLW